MTTEQSPIDVELPKADREKASLLTIVLPLFVLLGGGAAILVLWLLKPPPPPAKEGEVLIERVETKPVGSLGGRLGIEADGVVVPVREITLAAEVPGRVIFKSPVCRTGRYVDAAAMRENGQPLIKIDPRDYELAIAQLQQQQAQTDANIDEVDAERQATIELVKLAKETVELVEKEYARLETLGRRDFATESAIEAQRRSVIVARNELLTLQKQVEVLAARRQSLVASRGLIDEQLKKAELDLARTKIFAPISGVIISDPVEEDDHVTVGEPLVAIEDTSAVEVLCYLRLSELQWIWSAKLGISAERDQTLRRESPAMDSRPVVDGSMGSPTIDVGAESRGVRNETAATDRATAERDNPAAGYALPPLDATVTLRLGDRDFRWKGTLSRYDGIGLDPKTRTVPCRVVVPNPRKVDVFDLSGNPLQGASHPPALVREMFVTVRIMVQPDKPLVVIPETALWPGDRVWRVRQRETDGETEHVLQRVNVEVVETDSNDVIVHVLSGELNVGDPVVVSPLSFAKDGNVVEVVSDEDKKDQQDEPQDPDVSSPENEEQREAARESAEA